MAICEKCGKKYFQKECPVCKTENLERNLEKAKNVLGKFKKFVGDIIFEKEVKEVKKQSKIKSNYAKGYESLSKESKKEIFEKKRKERYKNFLKETKEKGIEYEKFVGKYFDKQGYEVILQGMLRDKKDEGIDIIAKKDNEIIFIQCKNWKENSKYKISHKEISSFVGKTYTFIEKNEKYKKYNAMRLFIASNDIFDTSAKRYCRENKNIVRYKVLKMEKSVNGYY